MTERKGRSEGQQPVVTTRGGVDEERKVVSSRLPTSLIDRVKREAVLRGRTVQEIMEEALEEKLSRLRKEQPRPEEGVVQRLSQRVQELERRLKLTTPG